MKKGESKKLKTAPLNSFQRQLLSINSFREKVKRRGSGRVEMQADKNFLDTILGDGKTPKHIMASDLSARLVLGNFQREEMLFERFRRKKRGEKDFYHVTLLNDGWQTGDENARIELTSLQSQVRPQLSKEFGNFLAVSEIQAWANQSHADGGKLLSLHCHAICWSSKLIDETQIERRIASKLGLTTNGTPSVKITLIRDGSKSLSNVVRYALKAPDRCKTLYVNASDPAQRNVHQSESGDRFIRYMRLCEILSLIPLTGLVFAGGEGAFVRNRAVYRLKQWHRERPKSTTILRAEDVETYWDRMRPIVLEPRFGAPTIK